MSDPLTLTDFLLARIADLEAMARAELNEGWEDIVLAECEAKRRIVECATNMHTSGPDWDEACRFLALPYADHPDYREEWKP
jgi:hypothetical protein